MDFVRILDRDALCSHIYVYNGMEHSATHPTSGTLPWPVELLLGGYSKRHIFATTPPVSIGILGAQLQQFSHKLVWRSVLRNSEPSWLRQFSSKAPIAACSRTLEPEVRSFIYNFKNDIHTFIFKSCSTCNPSHHSTWFRALSCAREWITSEHLCVVPSDKDGGWVLMQRDHFIEVIRNALVVPRYMRLGPSYIKPENITSFFRRHFRAVSRCYGDDSMFSFFNRQMHNVNPKKLIAKVQITMKTHKPPGLVLPRLIHASPNHPLASFSRFLGMHLRDGLKGCKHIYSSSDLLLKDIKSRVFSGNAKLYSADVGDFFLNGSPKDHSTAAHNHIHDPELRKCLKAALHDLLELQYVEFEGEQYAVTLGSGQGQIISGDVSDNTFFELVERYLQSILVCKLNMESSFTGDTVMT